MPASQSIATSQCFWAGETAGPNPWPAIAMGFGHSSAAAQQHSSTAEVEGRGRGPSRSTAAPRQRRGGGEMGGPSCITSGDQEICKQRMFGSLVIFHFRLHHPALPHCNDIFSASMASFSRSAASLSSMLAHCKAPPNSSVQQNFSSNSSSVRASP